MAARKMATKTDLEISSFHLSVGGLKIEVSVSSGIGIRLGQVLLVQALDLPAISASEAVDPVAGLLAILGGLLGRDGPCRGVLVLVRRRAHVPHLDNLDIARECHLDLDVGGLFDVM
ncbi:hypothetical protein HG530_010474 [Fusarium avenaceum]|nr:hypothetical protein HG530_010474 [Fusarium avenaceum]